MDIFSAEAFRQIDYKTLLIFSGVFLFFFALAEIAFHKFKVEVEYTRKFIHIFTGIIALFFPVYIKSPLDLVLLCGSFAILLVFSIKYNLLQSVNNVDRVSRGSVLYPVVVIICYLFQYYRETYMYFFIPILILAIADPVAALIGKRYPYGKYTFREHTKTLSGSGSFFIVAIFISFVALNLKENGELLHIVWISLLIASTTTIGEGLSIKGYDNIVIPLLAVASLLICGI